MYSKNDLIWTPITLLIAVIIAICTRLILKKLGRENCRAPFIIVTVMLLALEITKQIYISINETEHTDIPVQICSTVYLFYSLASFSKKGGRVSQAGFAMSMSIGLMICLGLLAVPNLITWNATEDVFTSRADFYTYHTLAFHFLLMLFVILAFALKPYKPNIKDYKWVVLTFGVYMAISAILAITLNQNYAMFLEFPFALLDPIKSVNAALYTFVIWLIYVVMISGLGGFFVVILPILIKRRAINSSPPRF
jgi:hypothetical protein